MAKVDEFALESINSHKINKKKKKKFNLHLKINQSINYNLYSFKFNQRRLKGLFFQFKERTDRASRPARATVGRKKLPRGKKTRADPCFRGSKEITMTI